MRSIRSVRAPDPAAIYGTLAELRVQEGDVVQEGDILAVVQ